MEQVLKLRQSIIKIYKHHELLINVLLKFLFGFMFFSMINSFDYGADKLTVLKNGSTVFLLEILLSLMFAVIPITLSFGLIILNVVARISGFLEVSVVVFLILLCIWFLYARVAAKESWFILCTILAFHFKIPYIIPIIAGLYFKPTVIIPISIGTILFFMAQPVVEIGTNIESASSDVMAMVGNFSLVYSEILSALMNNQTWVYLSFLFAMVVVEVYFISKLSIDYAREASVVISGISLIIGVIVLSIIGNFEISFVGAIVSTLISCLFAIVAVFFDSILDYSRSEKVSFEDEENYYFVKVIPKVGVIEPENIVNKVVRSGSGSGSNVLGAGNRGYLEENKEENRPAKRKAPETERQKRARRNELLGEGYNTQTERVAPKNIQQQTPLRHPLDRGDEPVDGRNFNKVERNFDNSRIEQLELERKAFENKMAKRRELNESFRQKEVMDKNDMRPIRRRNEE